MKIVVSIVSYNTADLIARCVELVNMQTVKKQIEVWVLDNASTDNSSEILERLENIHLIKNDQNVGFAKGHNIILKRVEADYYLILNPDTEFGVDAIEKMVQFMEANPKCQIASGKITDYKGYLQSNGGDLPVGLALVGWLFNLEALGIKLNYHRNDAGYYDLPKVVGWVGGTFMMVKPDLIKKTGLFDENYFMYFEDVDLCYKTSKRGFEVMINPEVVIKHLGGASSKNPRLAQWRGEYKGILHFYRSQFGLIMSLILRFLIELSILLRMIAFAIFGKWSVAKTYGQVLFTV